MISYNAYLDAYNWLCFVYGVVICFWNFVSGIFFQMRV